ncbi:hypothetical protein ACFLUJ_06935 [Chloroflexota bacterium]
MACYLCELESVEPTHPNMNYYQVECPICGLYLISHIVVRTILPQYADRKYLLTALTRQASDADNYLRITTENISSLLESIPSLSSPLENINRALIFVSQQQYRVDQLVNIDTQQDYPLIFTHDGREFEYLIQTLVDQGLLENHGASMGIIGALRLTPSGWQRVIELQKTQRQSDQAFVAMWFSPDLKEIYDNGIQEALTATGFHSYRVDQDEHNEKIDDRIVAEIRRSGLLVADFTGHRGGVYFEAGFAMGLGIPVIWTCKESDIDNAHFDTRQYNHITWNDAPELKSKLILRIEANIPGRTAKK